MKTGYNNGDWSRINFETNVEIEGTEWMKKVVCFFENYLKLY